MRGMRSLTDGEKQRVNENLDARGRALFTLGCKAGFRVSELLSLQVSDALTHDGAIASSIEVLKRNTKGKAKSRRVALHADARAALEAWVEVMRSRSARLAGPLFPSRKGSAAISRVQAYRLLTAAYRKAGLEGRLGTHAMRKTFAARIYEKTNRDLLKTQSALGHAQVTSTAAYLSFNESEVTAAILAA